MHQKLTERFDNTASFRQTNRHHFLHSKTGHASPFDILIRKNIFLCFNNRKPSFLHAKNAAKIVDKPWMVTFTAIMDKTDNCQSQKRLLVESVTSGNH